MVDKSRTYKPSLVIGLGGTGVLALRYLKAELLGSQTRQMPANVRLVALDTMQEQRRSSNQERQSRSSGPRTELDPREYYWLGGDIHSYVRQVAQNKLPQVASWLQAEAYLKQLPRVDFKLHRGANQLRQFVRLMIFKDVSAPSASSIYRLLREAVDRTKRGYSKKLDVYLVASAAGATGSGMFIDVAYLVKKIVEVLYANEVLIQGFLVLPEAFQSTITSNQEDMQARAFACMREVSRFMVDFKWGDGYPMYYHATGEDPIWRGKIKRRLFDRLYYVDGQHKNSSSGTDLSIDGVTQSIAAVISAMLDGSQNDGGNPYSRHTINTTTRLGSRPVTSDVGHHTAFNSTFGSYSIVLPMHRIVEDLSCHLVLKAIEAMLGPLEKDEVTTSYSLASRANQEFPGVRRYESSVGFLNSSKITSFRGERGVANTPLLREVARIATSYRRETPDLIQDLSTQRADAWESHLLEPGTIEQWPRFEQVQQDLGSNLTEVVSLTQEGESHSEAVQRIVWAVEVFKSEYLGRKDSRTGRYMGGRYHSALERCTQIHLEHFRSMLELQSLNILNGGMTPDDSSVIQEGAKLGHLQDFLQDLRDLFDRFLRMMDEAQEMRQARGDRASAERSVVALRERMEQSSGWLFFRHRRQCQEYLEAEESLFEIQKAPIIESIIRSLVRNMLDHVQDALESVEGWIRTLATGSDSLYVQLTQRRTKLEEMIKAQNREKGVSNILWDEEYRDRLYHKYAVELADGLKTILSDLSWSWDWNRPGSSEGFPLQLRVGVPEGMDEPMLATPKGQAQYRNLELLLSLAQQVFQPALEQESIMDYLMDNYTPQALLREIVSMSSPMLGHNHDEKSVSAFFLHAAYGQDESVQDYLQALSDELHQLLPYSESGLKLINSSDRFRCRLIRMLDLIQLDEMHSYGSCQRAYRQKIGTDHRQVHIFPAEVNAAKVEATISHQLYPRFPVLHSGVALQLEDMDRFRLFVLCWALGLVYYEHQSTATKKPGSFWCLHLPRSTWVQDDQKIYLTLPETAETSIIEAIAAWNYRKQDARQGLYHPIDYHQTAEAFRKARQNIIDKAGTEGLYRHLRGIQQELESLIKRTLKVNGGHVGRDVAIAMFYVLSEDIDQLATRLQHPSTLSRKEEKIFEKILSRVEVGRIISQPDSLIREPDSKTISEERFFKQASTSRTYDLILSATPDPVTVGEWIHLEVKLLPTTSGRESIELPSNTSKLYCFVSADGLHVQRGEVVTMSLDDGIEQPTKASLELQAQLCGERAYSVDLFVEDPESGQVHVYQASGQVTVTAPETGVKHLSALSPLNVRVAPQPDLVLQVETSLPEGKAGSHHLTYRLSSRLPGLRLSDQEVGIVVLSGDDLSHIRALLTESMRRTTGVQPRDARERMISFGNHLFDLLFPDDETAAFRELFWRASDRLTTWLIVQDAHTWLPWELLVPYHRVEGKSLGFLAEEYHLSRWVDGLGPPLYGEVPLGEIALVCYDVPEVVEEQKEALQAWRALLQSSGVNSIGSVLRPDTPFYGMHLIRDAESITARRDLVARRASSVPVSPEMDIQEARLHSRLKRPVVTWSILRKDNANARQNVDEWLLAERVLPFLRAGASAVVGPWWPTSEAADQVFWPTFYDLLARRLPLGEVVWRARMAVQQVMPESLDWLAYMLFGDPRARAYWPEPSEGYTVLECLNPDDPLRPGKTYTFRVSLRNRPPMWYKDRLVEPEALPERMSALFLAPGIQSEIAEPVEMTPLGRTMLQATVDLTPPTPGDYPILAQILEGDEQVKTLQLTAKVRETSTATESSTEGEADE